MHQSENCYVIEYTQYCAQQVGLNKQCSCNDLSLNFCNVFFYFFEVDNDWQSSCTPGRENRLWFCLY